MADKPDLKRYYSIGEVADRLGVNASQIRYWDNEFDHIRPSKNSRGERRFTKDNIAQLELIQYLLKDRGFTIDGARKEVARQRQQDPGGRQAVIDRLLTVRVRLKELL